MEILNLLENRMDDLLTTLKELREVNVRLEQERQSALESLDQVKMENATLKESLLVEQQKNASAQERVEAILQRLKGQLEI